MSSQQSFGYNSIVLLRSIGKRLAECMSGKGGVGAINLFLDQCHFVKGIEEYRNQISLNSMFFDTALLMCSPENHKRPEFLREEEIGALLGYSCEKCGASQSTMVHSHSRFCSCGGRFSLTYLLVHKRLRALNIIPTPEAVLMSVAWDYLAEAYIAAFKAFRLALIQVSERMGWDDVKGFVDPELKDKLDSQYFYLEAGDTRVAQEERELLMFIAMGNIAGIELPVAEKLIRLGCDTLKFGRLANQEKCSGAFEQFLVNRIAYSKLYDTLNEEISKATFVSRKEREKRSIYVLKLDDSRYYACAVLPEEYWRSGKLARNLTLKPVEKLPIFSTHKDCAVTSIVAPSGKGKTSLLSNIICEAVVRDDTFVLNLLGDDVNSLTLACLPMFPNKGRTGTFLATLEKMGVAPSGIRVMNLTFLRDNEKIRDEDLETNPPTIYDYVVDVREPYNFGFKFENSGKAVNDGKESPGVLNILEASALKMGEKKLGGCLINVRNLNRIEGERDKTKPDVEVATGLMEHYCSWRPNNKSFPAILVADEASVIAPVEHSVAGSDTSQSSATLSGVIKRIRKQNTAFILGAQKYNEINSSVRSEVFNVFFRENSQSGDKSRSQKDIVLDSLLLREGKNLRLQLSSLIEQGAFPDEEFWWFWWNKNRRDVQVIKPTVPFFMINQPNRTNREIFKAYEKFSGQKVLLKSWSEVPHLHYESSEFQRQFFRTA